METSSNVIKVDFKKAKTEQDREDLDLKERMARLESTIARINKLISDLRKGHDKSK